MARKRKIYVADFETTALAQYKLEGRTRVYLWKIKNIENTYSSIGVSIQSFFDELKSLPDESEVYFHNLSFDGEFILWYLIDMGYTFNKDKDDLLEKQFFSITDDFTHHFMICVMLSNGHKVTFKCSYRLFPLSIKKMGKLVGLDKLDETHDYEEIKNYPTVADVPIEELNYLENDVEIMRRFLTYMIEMGLNGLTMASVSYNSWKQTQWMFQKNLPLIKDEIVKEIIDMSYRGGMTYVNPKFQGKHLDSVISFDVNSLYPSVMLDGKMPFGEPKVYDKENEALEDKTYDLRIFSIVVHKAKIRKGYIPFIPLNGSFIFKGAYEYPQVLENKQLCLWEEEYRMFLDYYEVEHDVVRIVSFRSQYGIFDKYLEPLKKLKEEEVDGVKRAIYKLKMNSLYGKFGQSPDRLSKIAMGIREDGVLEYETVETDGSQFYKPIASRITCLARYKLVSAIQKTKERFVYCDTDSLYILGTEIPDIPIDDSKLGYWKFEGHYSKSVFLKAKGYLKVYASDELNPKKKWGEKESSVAGLPKDLQKELTFENFKDGLSFVGAKKVMKRVRGGVIIGNTNFTLKLKDKCVIIE